MLYVGTGVLDVDCWGVWGEALMVVWVGVCWGRGLRVPYGVYLWGGEWGAVAMKWDGWGEGFKAGGVEWGLGRGHRWLSSDRLWRD